MVDDRTRGPLEPSANLPPEPAAQLPPEPPATLITFPPFESSGFSSLLLRLTGEVRRGRAVYELIAPLTYGEGGIWVEVPAGYRTDFASIPRGLWNLFPPSGRYAMAAVIHDFLTDNETICSRFLADAVFREIMFRLGMPWYVRLSMYYAVRTYGVLSGILLSQRKS
jgi:hypothetical protein